MYMKNYKKTDGSIDHIICAGHDDFDEQEGGKDNAIPTGSIF